VVVVIELLRSIQALSQPWLRQSPVLRLNPFRVVTSYESGETLRIDSSFASQVGVTSGGARLGRDRARERGAVVREVVVARAVPPSQTILKGVGLWVNDVVSKNTYTYR
jgi:hypothetical protein